MIVTSSLVSSVCCAVLVSRRHHGIHERIAKQSGHGETPPAARARTGSPGGESQRLLVFVLILVLVIIVFILSRIDRATADSAARTPRTAERQAAPAAHRVGQGAVARALGSGVALPRIHAVRYLGMRSIFSHIARIYRLAPLIPVEYATALSCHCCK